MKGLFLLLLCVTVSSGGPGINSLVDKALDGGQEELRQLIRDEVARVPELSESWTAKAWPFSLAGELVCTGGGVKEVGSFRRTAEPKLMWDWDSVSIVLDLLFKEMVFDYESCRISLGFIKTSDPLQLRATDVLVRVELSMTKKRGRCLNYIDSMTILDFKTIDADMGSGLMSNIKEMILEYYVRRYHKNIVKKINENLETVSVNAAVLTNVCQQIFRSTL